MKKLILLIIIVFPSLGAIGQELEVTGTVSDAEGVPIPGVSILVDGTQQAGQ